MSHLFTRTGQKCEKKVGKGSGTDSHYLSRVSLRQEIVMSRDE